jgi:hypothetical protein
MNESEQNAGFTTYEGGSIMPLNSHGEGECDGNCEICNFYEYCEIEKDYMEEPEEGISDVNQI